MVSSDCLASRRRHHTSIGASSTGLTVAFAAPVAAGLRVPGSTSVMQPQRVRDPLPDDGQV
jgi:hypothetical protein